MIFSATHNRNARRRLHEPLDDLFAGGNDTCQTQRLLDDRYHQVHRFGPANPGIPEFGRMHFHRNKVGALYNIYVSCSIEGSNCRPAGVGESSILREPISPMPIGSRRLRKGEKTFLAVTQIVPPKMSFWQGHRGVGAQTPLLAKEGWREAPGWFTANREAHRFLRMLRVIVNHPA